VWARGLSLFSAAALGLGLAGWLAAGGLAVASWLARARAARLVLWEERAVGWALAWLAAGLLSGAWASQEIWGRAWRWTPGEGWPLIAALAAAAYAQVSSGAARRVILAGGLVATLLALGAGALMPDWPRLP
jgi:hypothetical protein